MATGDMIFLFTKNFGAGFYSNWVVPAGVTSIKVECFGGANEYTQTILGTGNYPIAKHVGGSYSQTSVLSVTPGNTIYMGHQFSGGDCWLNKNSNTVPTSTAEGCLAVGGSTAAASQVAANIGDIKYAGGDGVVTTSNTLVYGFGGQAGPNGSGAVAGGLYSNTPVVGVYASYYLGNGGGADGGISGGLGSIPYGRSSGAFGGNGGYWNGTAYVNQTQETLGAATYINDLIIKTPFNYGPVGGSSVILSNSGGDDQFTAAGQPNFIVITVLAPSQKSIVFTGSQSGSFTLPSDFSSLVSMRALGAAGTNIAGVSATQGGGGGGAGYSETSAASVTASMVAGSTVVYYNVGALGGGSSASSWINIGTNTAPSAVTSGVSAFSGGNTGSNTAGTGGSTASAVGSTKYAGGAGGAGFTVTRLSGGGGGGAAGPLGAGATGGAAWNSNAGRGGGGGGASNGGSAGAAPVANSIGGVGGAITGGSGGFGAAATFAATEGTNGGGGGGGYATTYGNPPAGSILLISSVPYLINGGTGGKGGQTGVYNSGGNGGAGVYYNYTYNVSLGGYFTITPVNGDGLVVFTYNATTPSPPVTTNSNFFFLF
jgi:hypothetical protein